MARTDPIDALSSHLADNLRHLRTARDLTQERLAALAGIPRSTLASIETGSGNPTLAVLARLALALRVTLEELLSPPRARCQLFRKGALPVSSRGRHPAVLVHDLLPHPIPGTAIDRMELPPGSRMAGVPHRPGTHEYLCCERGRIGLFVAGESLELEPGDVAAFAGDQRHAYEGRGRSRSVGFSVVTLAPVGGGG